MIGISLRFFLFFKWQFEIIYNHGVTIYRKSCVCGVNMKLLPLLLLLSFSANNIMSVSDIHNEISSSNLIKSKLSFWQQSSKEGHVTNLLPSIDIIEDLFSYNTVRRKRILEYYFFQDASLCSPIMSTEGIDNIQ